MIESVGLINWKVFDELTISFSQGVNFITGPNGIGKSSILQAICVAFSGQVPDGFDIRDFIHKGSDSCKIRVAYRHRGDLIYIERKLSLQGRERCSIQNAYGKETFSGSWDETTTYIENLLGMKKFLFNKISYLSEGDVYRTIREPPGKELFSEIDQLLGISQLQDLLKEIDKSKVTFQIERTKQTKILDQIRSSETEKKGDLYTLQVQLMKLQSNRDEKKDQLEKLSKDLWSCEEKCRRTEMLLGDLEYLDREEKILLTEQNKKADLEKQKVQMLKEHEEITRKRLKCEAEISMYSKVVDILKQTDQSGIEVECPICRRPISIEKMNQLSKEMTEKIASLEKKTQELIDQSINIDIKQRLLDSEIVKIKDREVRVRTLMEKNETKLGVEEIKKSMKELERRIEILSENIQLLNGELKNSDNEIESLRETLGNIKATTQLEKSDISEIENDLKLSYRGEYLSELTLKGIEELVKIQRNSKLSENLYNYISKIWNNFKGENGWTIEFDQSALPIARIRNQEYPFILLSAGEKTALLVAVRAILSNLFVKETGFLLLDEPLEHLDSRNRHSLLQFLVDAYKENIVTQLIITTTEYALLRRFVDYEYVKIHQLYRREGNLERAISFEGNL